MYDGEMPVRKMCRHCDKFACSRPKGLCWSCYYAPGVRDLYESTSKFTNHGICEDFYGGYAPPQTPTAAVPGSEAKMLVLAERAAAKVSLWHPDDVGAVRLKYQAVEEEQR